MALFEVVCRWSVEAESDSAASEIVWDCIDGHVGINAFEVTRQLEPASEPPRTAPVYRIRKAIDLLPGDTIKRTGARVVSVEPIGADDVRLTFTGGQVGIVRRTEAVGIWRSA